MKNLFKITSTLLLISSLIWNCDHVYENLLADNVAKEKDRVETPPLPKAVLLRQPFPNPLHRSQGGEIHITYEIPQAMRATLTVENVVGDVVHVLANQEHLAGVHLRTWDSKNNDGGPVKAGVYMIHLNTATVTQRKLIEIRE